jgi:ribosomal protein S18 acetylase RimI-like enzyme
MASYEEIVAQVASYSVHPELLACSVSTYYQSAIASGVVRRVDDIDRKARIVSAMMERLQPEGGYKSTVNAHSHSSEVPEKLLVCELLPEQIGAERKLGQGRTRAQIEQLLEWLWRRGQAGDVAAIRTILEAHPDAPEPRFLSTADERFVLAVSPNRPDARAVAELLRGEYWTHDFSAELMERAHLGTPAWVVARARDGSVVGSARVVSDGARFGYLMDVIVRRDLRGVGLGQALTRLVLDHPEVRQVLRIRLRTRDAQPFYEPLGFKSLVSHPNSTEMVRIRD